ncbi:uncharacterized protein LOC134280884 isoform X2 [Saccostrea cucullata]|uniref:uncharacterized protein LOC134280884 isoform X2 n=1 Tax=Saccostrea cuccullata TaxID=36930 RepID=UPI002ED02BDA
MCFPYFFISPTEQLISKMDQEFAKIKTCEVGTYGDRCTGGPCVYGYYGFGCQSKCNCTSDQYCDRKKGCFYNTTKDPEDALLEEKSYNSTVIIVTITAAIVMVISILVAIVFLCNKKLEIIRQFLRRRETNRPETAESVGAQEDYSQWTRNSNNYNMLSNRRFNADSKVSAIDGVDVYDHVDEGIHNSTSQDMCGALVFSKNHVMVAIDGNKENIHEKRNDVTDNTSGILRECYSLALNPDNSSESARENTKFT